MPNVSFNSSWVESRKGKNFFKLVDNRKALNRIKKQMAGTIPRKV